MRHAVVFLSKDGTYYSKYHYALEADEIYSLRLKGVPEKDLVDYEPTSFMYRLAKRLDL